MPTKTKPGALIKAIATVTFFTGLGGQVAVAAQPPDISTVRAAVDYYAARVKTLSGKYVHKMGRAPGAKTTPAAMREYRAEIVFRADLVSRKVLLDERSSYWLPGKGGDRVPFGLHTVRTSDGTYSAALIHSHVRSPVESKLPPDLPMWLNLAPHDNVADEYVPWTFCGLWMPGAGSLRAALAISSAHVENSETINGADCVRVSVGPPGEAALIVWLDQTHDFLPRRIELWRNAGGRKLLHGLDVADIRNFPDSAGAQTVWFPVVCRARNWVDDAHDLEIADLTINAPIDGRDVTIQVDELPDGIQVNDASTRGLGGFYTGGRKDVWDERKRLYDEEHAEIEDLFEAPRPERVALDDSSEERAPAVTAEAESGANWPLWLLGVAAICLIVGGWMSIARARRRSI